MATNSNCVSVSAPWWTEAWIIAHGPSARDFDLGRLHQKQVVAVNDFVAGLPPSDVAVFSADPNWVRRHKLLLSDYPGEKYVAIALDTHPDLGGIPGVIYLQRGHELGLSDVPGVLETGGNSGYAAINLAYLKRAKEIHLVGFDMDPGARGFDGAKFREWAPRFHSMLPQLKAKGVKVVNHNPNSYIDAFPKEI